MSLLATNQLSIAISGNRKPEVTALEDFELESIAVECYEESAQAVKVRVVPTSWREYLVY